MRHRIYTRDPLTGLVTIRGEELHHAARVVRVREGEEVELFDGRGNNFLGRFSAECVEILKLIANREPRTAISLAMSIIHLDKFEIVLQKATELGVHSFVPLITDRIEVRIERVRGKEDRWTSLFKRRRRSHPRHDKERADVRAG